MDLVMRGGFGVGHSLSKVFEVNYISREVS